MMRGSEEKMKRKGHKKSKKQNSVNMNMVILIIILYAVISFLLPVFLKYLIFENSEVSNLSNNEWAGFLGSYAGGILGGLGTLIAMWYTVRTSLEIQRKNKSDTDYQMQEEIKRRDEEYERDKKDRELLRLTEQANAEKRDREVFANSVANHLGVYISQISKYHYASIKSERLEKIVDDTKKQLEEVSTMIKKSDTSLSALALFTNAASQNHPSFQEAKTEAERKYNEALQNQKDNSAWGNRLKANEEYFIMKALLSDICEAQVFLTKLKALHHDAGFYHDERIYGEWLDNQTKELLEEYANFRRMYIKKM